MSHSSTTKTYTAEPLLSHAGTLFAEMWRDLLNSRELAWRLLIRNLSAMYRQTIFGYVWAFLPPLATSATFLFLKSGGVMAPGEIAIPYAAYLLISTSLWALFADAVAAPLRLVTTSRMMLIKINFPRESLILASIGEVLFNFLIRLSIIVGAMLWFQILPPATVFLVPVGILALLILGTMVGILLTPIGLLYQDVSKVLPMLLNFWMLLTPVVYATSNEGIRAELMRWNPVSPVLSVTRDWLVTGQTELLNPFLLITGLASLLLIFGWLLYRIAMPHVISRLGG